MEANVSDFKVHLTDGRKVYETGDTINGVCDLKVNGRMKRSMIRIDLHCVGEVQWTVQGPNTRLHYKHDHYFHERNDFLQLTCEVPPEEQAVLNTGTHKIPFSFHLKERGLPSSFQGQHGFISYYVNASIVDDLQPEPLMKTKSINVAVRSGIRKPDLLLPVGSDCHKEVGYWCFGKGMVHAYANLPRKGYSPGQHIELDVHIMNESPVKVRARVTLYQTRVFLSRNRHHSIEEHFDQIDGAVVSKGKDHMETLIIPVPEDASLTMKTSIIVIKYFLHITLDIPREFDAHINLPVVLTTQSALVESRSN